MKSFGDIFGFAISLSYNGAEAAKRMGKDIDMLNQRADRLTRTLLKKKTGIGSYFDKLERSVEKTNRRLELGAARIGITVDRVARFLGDGAADIVSKVLSVEGALMAAGAAAVTAYSQVDKTQAKVYRESLALSGSLADIADIQIELARSTGMAIADAGRTISFMASRNIAQGREDMLGLSKAILYTSRVTGASIEKLQEDSFVLSKSLGMSASEISSLLGMAVQMGRVTGRTSSEAVSNIDAIAMAAQRLPQAMQKGAIPALLAMQQILGDVLDPGQFDVFVQSFTTREALPKIARIGGLLGADVMKGMLDAFQSGDVEKGFRKLLDGMTRLNPDRFKQFAQTFENVFGFDIRTLERMRAAGVGMFDDAIKKGREAAKDSEFLSKLYKDVQPLGEKFGNLLTRLLVIAAPLGKLLFGILHVVLDIANVVTEFVGKLVNMPVVSTILQVAVAMAALGVTTKVVFASVVLVSSLALKATLSLGAAIMKNIGLVLEFGGNVIWALKTIGVLFLATMRNVAAGMAAMAASNPVLATFVGISAAVLGVITLIKTFPDEVDWVFSKLKNIVRDFGNFLHEYFVQPWVTAWDAVTGLFDSTPEPSPIVVPVEYQLGPIGRRAQAVSVDQSAPIRSDDYRSNPAVTPQVGSVAPQANEPFRGAVDTRSGNPMDFRRDRREADTYLFNVIEARSQVYGRSSASRGLDSK